jgi:REP element-mobilizing transposase RayT
MEVTCRTLHARLLLRPSPELDEIIGGILGRAQRLYPLQLINYVFASNHYHLLVWVQDAERLSQFVGYLNSNLAREVSRLTGWSGKIWEKRYQAIPVSNEEAAQVERFRYVLSHGVKENLVAHLADWPGVHAVRQLLGDEPLTGYWFDRTQEYSARRRREEHDRLQYATLETVTLSPLPCWEGLTPEAYRERVAGMVAAIEEDAAAARRRTGAEPLGPKAILAQHPHSRPKRIKKSPAPFVHAASKAMRQFLYESYALFVAAYRAAAEKLRAGDPAPGFPAGCFPPALSFVRR